MNGTLIVVLTAVTTSIVWWVILQLWLKEVRWVVAEEFTHIIIAGMLERAYRHNDNDLRKLINQIQGAFKSIAETLFLTGGILDGDFKWVEATMCDAARCLNRKGISPQVTVSSQRNVVFKPVEK